MRKNPAKNKYPAWKNRIPLSPSKKIQRSATFKKFKEQNLEKLQVEIEAEAALQNDDMDKSTPVERVLLRAFAKTPEGLEVQRQIEAQEEKKRIRLRRAQTWSWFCDEIILRSNSFFKWCRRKRIPPYPIFNLDYCPPRVHINPAIKTFNEFFATKPGRRATEKLQVHKYIWPHLYRKQGKRGFGIKDLMPQDDYKSPDCPDPSELIPLRKALVAYDMSKHQGLIILDGGPQGALVTHGTSQERNLMEITRRLFPHTEGKHPAYDEEANRCLQQVKRWIEKVGELIRLVDSP